MIVITKDPEQNMNHHSPYQHAIQSGDIESADGWVIRDGKPVFKWFDIIRSETSDQQMRVWRPALQDIARIEALFWRSHQMYHKNWQKNWPIFIKRFQQNNIAAFVPHPNDENYHPDEFFLYEYCDYAGEPSIAEKGWKKGKPPANANLDLGHEYRQFSWQRQRQLGGRIALLKIVLERAFERWLPTLETPTSEKEHQTLQRKVALMASKMLRIQVNGRFYWYQFVPMMHGLGRWEPQYWPDKELEEINLDESL